jgi:hypothetical protein
MNLLRGLSKRIYRAALAAAPPSMEFQLRYFRKTGKLFNLATPRTFSEKVQWRKVYERDPRMPDLLDKTKVKCHVAHLLGEEWIIPTLFSGPTLPPREERTWTPPYVIKPTHRSQKVIFINEGDAPDWDAIDAELQVWNSEPYGVPSMQWAYWPIVPGVIVEPNIAGDKAVPIDYKFFVFGGTVHFIQVDRDRFNGHKQSFFDCGWKRQPFHKGLMPDPENVPCPASLGAMIEAAETLGADWSFVRIDLYDANRHPKFGEFTFYPASGRPKAAFQPPEYERIVGELWHLR